VEPPNTALWSGRIFPRCSNTHTGSDAPSTYYVGHETVVPDEADKALPRVVEALFAFMQRNSAHLTEYLRLPMDAVVEIGRQVSI
jgi:K+ transporter